MNKTAPKITVLMPSYNAGKYIREAISSVLAQTFTDFELLIINDGSTDDSIAIIESFDDQRIRLINQPHNGIAAALNIGLLNAAAELIARFDADDICYPFRLQQQYDMIRADPEYILVGSDADYIDKHGEHLYHYSNTGHTGEEIAAGILQHCPFIHSSVLYNKKVVLDLGGYDTRAHTFEDHLLWTQLIEQGKVCNLNEALIAVRLNPESVTVDEKLRGKRFVELKRAILAGGKAISTEQEAELLQILQRQDFMRFKHYSYNILVAKKYLWNNYQPARARKNAWKALRFKPFRPTGYALLALSCMPQKFIANFYRKYKPFANY